MNAQQHLYFISAANGVDNMDLFVWASSPLRAVYLWEMYYHGWDKPERVKVWTVPATMIVNAAIEWEAIPSEEISI